MSKLTLTAKEQRKKRDQMTKIVITVVILVLVSALIIYWVLMGDNNKEKNGTIDINEEINNREETNINSSGEELQMVDSNKYKNIEKNPIVTMKMANGGEVKIELYPKIAPVTVENFISLIESGFYNGLTFHRVMPEFMAQGGDPSGDGTGGPGYSIFGEFSDNGFKNDLTHEIGVISMARANEPNSAGSQFFIVTDKSSYLSLDGKYAGFGKVIEGMDVVYEIVNSETVRKEYSDNIKKIIEEKGEIDTYELYYQYMQETAEMARPINPPVIEEMTVDTFGVEYDEPEKLK